jgi:glutamine synthetase
MIKLEYVWLDGYTPEPNLRSKIKVVDKSLLFDNGKPVFANIPKWNFDGSSTQQAEGHDSDCILEPVRLYMNDKLDKIYVFCEVMYPDGTPHPSNRRADINSDSDIWFGFEQEYFIKEGKRGNILGHTLNSEPQGRFYCGVGSSVVGRELVEEHLDMCLSHGITITGVNAEVALGQWEYQVFSKGSKKAGDDLWMSRYFMEKISEKYGYHIEYHPKPLGKNMDWNGSGLHTNFSTGKMRDKGGEEYFKAIFQAFDTRKDTHIEVYGSDNDMRLTGKHETQSIDKFSWGVADRGASIRVPRDTAKEWKGYLEDRRPASNANPYEIIREIIRSLDMADELSVAHRNMYTNVDIKKFDDIASKFNGVLKPEELLKEYRDEDDYELTEEMMESKANIESTEIEFENDKNGSIYND